MHFGGGCALNVIWKREIEVDAFAVWTGLHALAVSGGYEDGSADASQRV